MQLSLGTTPAGGVLAVDDVAVVADTVLASSGAAAERFFSEGRQNPICSLLPGSMALGEGSESALLGALITGRSGKRPLITVPSSRICVIGWMCKIASDCAIGEYGIAALKKVLPVSPGTYLTINEISTELQVSRETVRQWIVSGELPAFRAGGWRVKRSDLDRMIVSRTSTPPQPPSAVTDGASVPNPMGRDGRVDIGFADEH